MQPKKKKRHGLPPVEVNIVSLMDILTTLLFFILMAMSFSNFSILDASALLAGQPSDKKENVFALKIIVKNEKLAEIELGPIQGLKISNKNWFNGYMSRNYSGNPKIGYIRRVYGRNITHVFNKVQKILTNVKKGFPHENKVVLAFTDRIKYQDMIIAMNKVRSLSENSKAFAVTTLIGQREKTRVLFPSVVIAESRIKK